MKYRTATVADADALAVFAGRLFVQSYQQWMERSELENYIAEQLTPAALTADLSNPAMTTFLAIDDNGEIAGYAQLAFDHRPECALPAEAPVELKRIYVDRAWHGQQVAPELLMRVLDAARSRGCDVLWLAVWEINERAIGFYEKHRFRVVGRQGFPIGNEVQTDHVMARTLADELH